MYKFVAYFRHKKIGIRMLYMYRYRSVFQCLKLAAPFTLCSNVSDARHWQWEAIDSAEILNSGGSFQKFLFGLKSAKELLCACKTSFRIVEKNLLKGIMVAVFQNITLLLAMTHHEFRRRHLTRRSTAVSKKILVDIVLDIAKNTGSKTDIPLIYF